MKKQPAWNNYETALLLEACLVVEEDVSQKSKVISNLSYILRQKAISSGLEIDNVYRNTNGIALQMLHMQFLLTRGKIGLPGASKNYINVANLYMKEKEKFKLLLQHAHEEYGMDEISGRCGDVNWKYDFSEWLVNQEKVKYPRKIIVGSIDKISEQALKTNIISYSLWEVQSVKDVENMFNAITGNKQFFSRYKAMLTIFKNVYVYYLVYLRRVLDGKSKENKSAGEVLDNRIICRDYLITNYNNDSPIETIFLEYYKRGFVAGNIMHQNRLIALYCEKFNETIDSEVISEFIMNSCFEYEGKNYLPKAIISKNIIEKIVDDIELSFVDNDVIFYRVLYNKYKDDFSSAIYSCEMFVACLAFVFKTSAIYFLNGYMALEKNIKVNIREVVLNFLLEADKPCSKEEIFSGLKDYNPGDIEKILRNNTPEILGDNKFDYFHVGVAHFTEDDIRRLNNVCELMLKGNKYITCIDLIEKIKTSDSSIYGKMEDRFSELGMRRILMYYLKINFEVSTGIVSHKGNKMSVTDVFVDYAKCHDTFTTENVMELTNLTGTQAYWEPICMNAVRINQNDFVCDSRFVVDVEAVDEVISLYCKDYSPLGAFVDFSRFPLIDYSWNRFLLYSYVLRFSKQFKLVQLSYPGKDKACGVIVNREYDYPDFDSVAYHLFCKKCFRTVDEAKEYMYQNGYIATRQYKNAEELLKKAKANNH